MTHRKKNILIIIIGLISLLTLTHCFTYKYDKSRIAEYSNPKFCIITGYLDDGGTTFYSGFGYQIIKWSTITQERIQGKDVQGLNHGFEIHRFPFYVDWEKGPTVKLKFKQFK